VVLTGFAKVVVFITLAEASQFTIDCCSCAFTTVVARSSCPSSEFGFDCSATLRCGTWALLPSTVITPEGSITCTLATALVALTMLGALLLEIPLVGRQKVTFDINIGIFVTGMTHWAESKLALAHFGTKTMVLRAALSAFSGVSITSVLLTEVVITLATTVTTHARICVFVHDFAEPRALDLLTVLTVKAPFASTECAISFIR
jgi:hypothetical protein